MIKKHSNLITYNDIVNTHNDTHLLKEHDYYGIYHGMKAKEIINDFLNIIVDANVMRQMVYNKHLPIEPKAKAFIEGRIRKAENKADNLANKYLNANNIPIYLGASCATETIVQLLKDECLYKLYLILKWNANLNPLIIDIEKTYTYMLNEQI